MPRRGARQYAGPAARHRETAQPVLRGRHRPFRVPAFAVTGTIPLSQLSPA
jgi:hypothetical protein